VISNKRQYPLKWDQWFPNFASATRRFFYTCTKAKNPPPVSQLTTGILYGMTELNLQEAYDVRPIPFRCLAAGSALLGFALVPSSPPAGESLLRQGGDEPRDEADAHEDVEDGEQLPERRGGSEVA
jgi:hypothetical protein